jgi:tripartite-type tricarboxylate transporter receptor subunit TctC
MKIINRLVFCISILAGGLLAWSSQATEFPTRPIKVLIPYAAGGTTDIAARKLGSIVEKTLGQPIVVENKPGGSGTIAVRQVARAKPDGYTLVAITSSPAFITPSLRDVGYDPIKDLTPILNYSGPIHAIVVNTKSSWKTLDDMINEAKAHPGSVTCGTAGTFAGAHITLLYIQKATGVTITHVPFKGQAPATEALLGGHISAAIVPAYADYVKAGKFRLLANADFLPDPEFPDMPTLHDLGYDWEFPSIVGLMGPAGMPEDIRAKLEKAFMEGASTQEFKDFMAKVHLPVRLLKGEEFGAVVKKNYEAYAKTIKELALKQ